MSYDREMSPRCSSHPRLTKSYCKINISTYYKNNTREITFFHWRKIRENGTEEKKPQHRCNASPMILRFSVTVWHKNHRWGDKRIMTCSIIRYSFISFVDITTLYSTYYYPFSVLWKKAINYQTLSGENKETDPPKPSFICVKWKRTHLVWIDFHLDCSGQCNVLVLWSPVWNWVLL